MNFQKAKEPVIYFVLLGVAAAAMFFSFGRTERDWGYDLLSKLAFAIVVAVMARTVAQIFSSVDAGQQREAARKLEEEKKRQSNPYRSSKQEYNEALAGATKSIWICQTWLPGLATYTDVILKKNPAYKQKRLKKLRVVLASFKPQSHIYARIIGRSDIKSVDDAKTLVKTCVAPFVKENLGHCLKFNFGHYPGWITIIDGRDVFWGFIPVDIDNNTHDYFFHKDTVEGEWGAFWKQQFELIWDDYSHDLRTEQEFNERLRELQPRGAAPLPTG